MRSLTFSVSVDIDAPVARVWQVMSDVDRWHEWTPSITSIQRVDGTSLEVGTRAIVRQPKLPRATWTVTALESGRGFTWVSTAPGVRMVAHHRVEPVGAGSRATLVMECGGLLGRAVGRLTRQITNRYLGFEASGLKARSENANFHHGARG
jgi:uncharacterized membrane protein